MHEVPIGECSSKEHQPQSDDVTLMSLTCKFEFTVKRFC